MKKVVVAEASSTIKSVADSLLRQNGYDVVCTSDGLQAWEVVASERPDLVLVGLGLSGISGLDLCRQMASDRITGGIPLVLMIGARDTITEEEIISSGARGKLRKPFSPKDLLDIVNKLVGRPSGPINRNEPPGANQTDSTHYVAQVNSTQHLNPKGEEFNLEWLDLSEKNQTTSTKVASINLASEDQGLIIEDDQYGLSNPMPFEAETSTPEVKDEDYEWFIGEIKREIEHKTEKKAAPKELAPESPSFGAKAGDEIKFDDLGPAGHDSDDSEEPTVSWKTTLDKRPIEPSLPSAYNVQSKPDFPNLSDENIEKLSDLIAVKLANHLIAGLDRNRLVEAIKAALRG